MDEIKELRASKRVPATNRVQVATKGKVAVYALAINISMGGILLSAAPPLPVGSRCRLDILLSSKGDGRATTVEGTVVRNDKSGTAIQFGTPLDENTYDAFANPTVSKVRSPFFNSYISYFRVSQDVNHEGCEQIFGVSSRTFKTVVLSSFLTCIPLATIPVFFVKDSIQTAPAWLKIVTSFGYASVWLGIIQPSIDLAVFKIIKYKNTNA